MTLMESEEEDVFEISSSSSSFTAMSSVAAISSESSARPPPVPSSAPKSALKPVVGKGGGRTSNLSPVTFATECHELKVANSLVIRKMTEVFEKSAFSNLKDEAFKLKTDFIIKAPVYTVEQKEQLCMVEWNKYNNEVDTSFPPVILDAV